MADSYYSPQSAHQEPSRQQPYPPPDPQDPTAPRTDAMSTAASGALPPQDPAPSQHYAYSAPAPDPGPQGRPGYYKPSAYEPSAYTESSPPADNLPHGEHRHRRWSERMHELGTRAAEPINTLANKMGSQAFLPSTMDKECEKAASILLSFCKEGAHGEGHRPKSPTTQRPRSRDRALLKIPTKVLKNAVGLAIFTTARAGFQFSASTGSGILIARRADDTWGAPSGIQVHALGAGFLAGADIYDCICVINTKEALETFSRTRVSLGPEVALAAGPFGAGGKMQVGASAGSRSPGEGKAYDEPLAPGAETNDPAKLSASEKPQGGGRSKYKAFGPVFTYVKSRGLFAGVHVDGTVITERKEANAAFYGERVSVSQILSGEELPAREAPQLWPLAARGLHDALRRAESRPAEDEVIVPPTEATPAINDPKPGHGMGEGQGQGGADPVPREGGQRTGSVSGAAHSTTDELPAYEGTGDSIRGQKVPEPGQSMPDTIPREGEERKGTVGGADAHASADELPAYPGSKAPVSDEKKPM